MKAQVNKENIVAYLQGHIRYRLFYSKFKFLIRKHILEQIDMRISSMNKECYDEGSCIKCGCMTTHLQMADKPCEGACYPLMLSSKEWFYLKNRKLMLINKVLWKISHGKFVKIGK